MEIPFDHLEAFVDLEMTNKVAIVTGGSKGIGLSTAHLLAREGAQVVIAARGEEALRSAAKEIRLSSTTSPSNHSFHTSAASGSSLSSSRASRQAG